jgi:holo-[acyl-carrier protein] synthase
MIVGVGIDLVEVSRMEKGTRRHGGRFLARLFTPAEVAHCDALARPFESYAARFAAKEAFLKALGAGSRDGICWHDMEVAREGRGPPELVLTGRAREVATRRGVAGVFLSLSHTEGHATAVVVLEAGVGHRTRGS